MQEQKNVIACYDSTAEAYAEKFIDELNQKHFDRILLTAFAAENTDGKLIDLGCGPGQTTKYLYDVGVKNITGTDISPNMIAVAKRYHPHLHFEVADLLHLPYADCYFNAAIVFYVIVHLNDEQLQTAFREIKRILSPNGQFLFSFHVGDTSVHRDEFLGRQVNVDFHFFNIDKIISLLIEAGFEIKDAIERQPYPGVEYASKRAYIWGKNWVNNEICSTTSVILCQQFSSCFLPATSVNLSWQKP